MSEPLPHRRYTIEAHVSGDTPEDAAGELRMLADRLECGSKGPIISGGTRSGSWLSLTEDPDMTPERYMEELRQYRKSRKPTPESPA